jgi:hypothetical protein
MHTYFNKYYLLIIVISSFSLANIYASDNSLASRGEERGGEGRSGGEYHPQNQQYHSENQYHSQNQQYHSENQYHPENQQYHSDENINRNVNPGNWNNGNQQSPTIIVPNSGYQTPQDIYNQNQSGPNQ